VGNRALTGMGGVGYDAVMSGSNFLSPVRAQLGLSHLVQLARVDPVTRSRLAFESAQGQWPLRQLEGAVDAWAEGLLSPRLRGWSRCVMGQSFRDSWTSIWRRPRIHQCLWRGGDRRSAGCAERARANAGARLRSQPGAGLCLPARLPVDELPCRHRLGNDIALQFVAAHGGRQIPILLSFGAFGDHAHAERVSQAHA